MLQSNLFDISLITQVVHYLGIKKPFDIKIKSKAHKWAAGFCEQHTRKGKIIKHVITIYLPVIVECNYSLESVILHELIHAYQAEFDILEPGKYHNSTFQRTARELEKLFKITGIYCEKSDVD